MRNLLMAIVVLGLLAAPSFGVINIKLLADQTTLAPGGSTMVHVWAQGTASGVYAVGGYIVATAVSGNADALTSTAGSMVFDALFNPAAPFAPKPGAPDAAGKGGWGDLAPATAGFGTMQTGWVAPDPTLGKADYVEICHYTVVGDAVTAVSKASLGFVAKSVSGYKCQETDKSAPVFGTISPVVITVTPEPATMILLALGGLALVRRRR